MYQPIIPHLNATWDYYAINKKITIQLREQTQAGDIVFNVPVEIGYYTKGNTTPAILKMNLTSQHQTQTFKVNLAPEKLEFDPRNILLAKINFAKKD